MFQDIKQFILKIIDKVFILIMLLIAILFLLFGKTALNLLDINILLMRPISLVVTSIESLGFLSRDHSFLEEEIKKLNIDLEIAHIENIKLRDLLHFVPHHSLIYKTTKLLLFSSGPYTKTAIIEGGIADGLSVNQILVLNNNLVGRIIEVGEHSSKILLITDFNSRIPVMTGVSRQNSLAIGNNSELLDLIYIENPSELQINEMVVTSGEGQFYPAGLPIGRIVSINPDGSGKIEPNLNMQKLEFMHILEKLNESMD